MGSRGYIKFNSVKMMDMINIPLSNYLLLENIRIQYTDTKGTIHSETPTVPSRFLSLTANKIAIWDALQEKAPLSYIKVSENPLNCASWSPNQPRSLIVCGGVDKELKIIDTRTAIGDDKGVAWSTKNAHDRPIRDTKFNPFLPYWLASAGEDAIVNIWDVRGTHHAPVAKIDGHSSMISSISWSNIRPENILTASFDGTMRFWALSPETYPIWDTHYRLGNYGETDSLPLNYGSITKKGSTNKGWSRQSNGYMYAKVMESWLSDGDSVNTEPKTTMKLVGALGLGEWGRREPGPIYKGEPIVEARGAVLSITSARSHPNLYYCITGGGQLTSQTMRSDVATTIKCYHRQYNLKDKDSLIKEIETDIYVRKIDEAKKKLDILRAYSYDNEEYAM
ncbi:WD40 repeat-like protein [Backusella circina FSU 941]|nr:WD40 repeat-like protein [Backusella circina FSU 941]